MNKLILFFDLFRKGAAVSDPKLWKDRTALTLALTGVILAIVKVAGGLGYAIPISETEAATLAAAVAIVVGLLSTYTTSDKIGLLPAKVQPDRIPALDAEQPAATERQPAEPYNAERGS